MRASLLRALRARQVDVTTAAEANLLGYPDEEQLVYATAQMRTIFTSTGAILRGYTKPGRLPDNPMLGLSFLTNWKPALWCAVCLNCWRHVLLKKCVTSLSI